MEFRNTLGVACGMGLIAAASAFALPTATEVQQSMGFGINIGNTMEAPKSPTAWGNPYPTAEYIKSLKDAGFTSVRIPCAWYSHSNAIAKDSSFTYTNTGDEYAINPTWLDSVKTVVDMVIDNGMYAVLNSHWDDNWLENRLTSTDSATVVVRQKKFWGQIAEKFKSYDEHLLFASTNEPGLDQSWSGKSDANDLQKVAILKAYNQAMIDTVRATGSNNSTRTVIIQGPKTDENLTHLYLSSVMPEDPAGKGYMMGEFHFYPYQFSMMTEDADWGSCFYYWGDENYSTTDTRHNANVHATWTVNGTDTAFAEEAAPHQYASPFWVDSVFSMLKADFVDQGIPLVIGEYAAIKRPQLTGEDLRLHLLSRVAFYEKVTKLSKEYGFVPFAWDTGAEGDADNTIMLRQNGHSGIFDYNVLNGMRRSYGLDTLEGDIIDSLVNLSTDTTNRAVVATYDYSKVDSAFGQMGFSVTQSDISKYDSLVIRTYVQGTTNGACSGEYGFLTMDIVTMDNVNWSWRAAHLNASVSSDDMGKWVDYGVKISANASDTADGSILVPNNPSKLGFIGLQTYQKYFTGIIAVDYILFIDKDTDTYDTLYTFNKSTATPDGAVTSVSLVSANKISSVTVPTVGSCKDTSTTDNSVKAVYSISDSLFGQIAFSVAKDWSNYTSVSAKVYTKGEVASSGSDYGYVSFSFVTMDGANWDWQEAALGNAEMDTWKIYTADIASTGTSGDNLMVPGQIDNVAFFALQIYSKYYTGAIYVDWIAFTKADGTADTLTLNSTGASSVGGGITSKSLIATSSVESDDYKSVSIKPVRTAAAGKLFVSVQNGMVNAAFTTANAGAASAKLINGLGQVIAYQNFTAHAGANTVQLKTGFRGPAMLMVKQGSATYLRKVILK